MAKTRIPRTILFLALLLAPPLLAAAQAGTRASGGAPYDADLIKGKTVPLYFYQNHYFSFGMTIPGGWHPMPRKQLLELVRKESGESMPPEQPLEGVGGFFLLGVPRYPPARRGPGGEANPNFVVLALDVSRMRGIKSPKDCIELIKGLVKAEGVMSRADPYPVRLGGVDFWRLDGTERSGELLYTTHIVTLRKGYALDFQLMAGSKADVAELVDILKSLDFD